MLAIEICGWELQSTVIGHRIVLYISTSIWRCAGTYPQHHVL